MSTGNLYKKRGMEDSSMDDSAFGRLARTHFRLQAPPQFSRKDIRQPLLKATPDDDKEIAQRVWRVILRFMGDVTDYRQNIEHTHQPYMGSVMSRLTRDLGLDTSDPQIRKNAAIVGASENSGLDLRSLPNKPKGGTLRSLRATLTQRLFNKAKNDPDSIFHSLPIEDTLLTPLEQVHFIIGCGILKPALRDEIYCQVCRQLIKNPYKTSVSRGWVLLGLIITCFPPSQQIVETVTGFIAEGPSIYGTSMKRLLTRSLKNGARYQPPASIELETALGRKSLELPVTLMDGTVQTVIIDGATTSHDMCFKVAEMVGVRQKFGFSIFISMYMKVASLGNGGDHVMDAISQCEQIYHDQHGAQGTAPWRLFYRKELFTPWDDLSGDMIGISLIYAQVVRGVTLGEYTCDSDQELAVLVARQYYIEYAEEVSDEALGILLPSYIPTDRRQTEDECKAWRKIIMKHYNRMFGGKDGPRPPIERVKLDIANFAKMKWAMSFSRYYDVNRLEGHLADADGQIHLAINSTGVYLLSNQRRMLQEISFPEISTIKGERLDTDLPAANQVIMFVVADGSCLQLETLDADDIRDTVDFLMTGLRRRSVWAVAKEDKIAMKANELGMAEGDLIELDTAAGHEALTTEVCHGRNTATNLNGDIASDALYVLPVTIQPSEQMLKMFRFRKRHLSFSTGLDESTTDTDVLNSNDLDQSNGISRSMDPPALNFGKESSYTTPDNQNEHRMDMYEPGTEYSESQPGGSQIKLDFADPIPKPRRSRVKNSQQLDFVNPQRSVLSSDPQTPPEVSRVSYISDSSLGAPPVDRNLYNPVSSDDAFPSHRKQRESKEFLSGTELGSNVELFEITYM